MLDEIIFCTRTLRARTSRSLP